MIDLKDLRENRELYEKGFAKKCVSVDIDALLKLDEEHRAKIVEVEAMRSERNEVSKLIPTLNGDEKNAKVHAMRELGEKLKAADEELNKIFVQLKEVLAGAPNPPHESVPEGKDETQNAVARVVGEKPSFDFEPKDHIALGEALDIIDIETGTETSGSRFYYLKNEAVLLEFALVNWLFGKYVKKGFTPVTVPMLV